MRTARLAVVFAVCSFTFVFGQVPQGSDQDRLSKLPQGIYYKSGTGEFVSLDPIMMAGGGAKHVGKMFVPGLTPQIVWTYRGAMAPARFVDLHPIFYFCQPSQVNIPGHTYRDLVMVRFDKKKDHRELQTTSGGNMFTFKAGISKERLPDIVVEKVMDGVYRIASKDDLKPGEYLLTFGIATSGYDFGVDERKP